MNTTVQTPSREDVPSCFGTPNWDPRASECAGGADPKYLHPQNGSHVREACDFFNHCGARVQAARLGSNLFPAAQLRRPPAITAPAPAPATLAVSTPTQPSFREYMQQQMMQQQRPVPTQQPLYYPQQHPPQHPQMYAQQASQQHHYPAPSYQLNYQVPGYLSVPEVRTYGGSVWGILGREAVRAALKAMGHTIAAYFDMNPFRLPPPPPPPGGSTQ